MAQVTLMMLSALILAGLGTAHLRLTFFGPKLLPRDLSLKRAMHEVSPVITSQTSFWQCWIGFNASHSMGAILFGLIYGYLVLAQPELLFGSLFLQIVGLAMLSGFVVLAKLYWFSTPLLGTSIALICYLLSLGLSWAA